jgi:ribosomal protein S18 acetylase RimI-like enzyme
LHIERLTNPVPAADFEGLCAILLACVRAGVSIGFVEPVAPGEIEAYWRKVAGEAAAGTRVILVAREGAGGPVIGSAQLAFEAKANGRHRGEVQKVIVSAAHRRRGVAAALMAAVESEARDRRLTLLFLDTTDGPKGARGFYDAVGYAYVGGIPGYAVDPDGTPERNAIYYKALA